MEPSLLHTFAWTYDGSRGLPAAEFNYRWHTHAPSVAEARDFLAALNRTYDRTAEFFRPLEVPQDGGLEAVVSGDVGLSPR